jgi:hypothetical protein
MSVSLPDNEISEIEAAFIANASDTETIVLNRFLKNSGKNTMIPRFIRAGLLPIVPLQI